MTVPWPAEAAALLARRVGPRRHAPWRRGLWLSWREHYEPVGLPPWMRIEETVLAGELRRVARAPGSGRPLLILPGAYGGLHERLFVQIAVRAAASGRPVLLLEDRLAAGTVRCSGAPVPSLSRLGRAVTELVARQGGVVDVLALSMGLLPAWAAGPVGGRIVGFSGVPEPAAVVAALRDSPLAFRRFARRHARSGLAPALGFEAVLHWLSGLPRLEPPDGDWLLVHADDDPVSPVACLDHLPAERVCRLPAGGHLAFARLAGLDLYLAPFLRPGDPEVGHA